MQTNISFTCDKNKLSKVVHMVMRVANQSATLESLQGIFIEVVNSKTIIKATNLEVGIEMTIPATDMQDGAFLVNPKLLIDAIKYSDSNMITISSKKAGSINIKLDNGNTIVKTLNDSDFPNIPKQNTGEKLDIKVKNIINGIKSVLYAVSHSVIKPELSSLYIWKDGQQLVFVATDSFRLAEKKVNQNIINTDDLSILIPQKNTQDLLSILEQLDEGDNITVQVDNDQFSVYTDDMYITLRTIDGAFPDYQKIIPKEAVTSVTVLKHDLSQIIKKAGVFSDKFNKITIKADAENKLITVSTVNGEAGETVDSITGVLEGETVEISLNHRFIIDCLQSVHSDSVVLSFFGQGKPLIVSGVGDKSFIYLVMPMNN